MRVVMKTAISGTRNGASWPAVGEEIELPDEEASNLVHNGLALPAPEPVSTEHATRPRRVSKRKS